MAERGRHAVVFETARRVHAFILKMQPARRDADIIGHAFRLVQQCLAFADGDAFFDGGERQQIVESPHAAEAVRIVPLGPFSLEVGQFFGNRQSLPIVGDV